MHRSQWVPALGSVHWLSTDRSPLAVSGLDRRPMAAPARCWIGLRSGLRVRERPLVTMSPSPWWRLSWRRPARGTSFFYTTLPSPTSPGQSCPCCGAVFGWCSFSGMGPDVRPARRSRSGTAASDLGRRSCRTGAPRSETRWPWPRHSFYTGISCCRPGADRVSRATYHGITQPAWCSSVSCGGNAARGRACFTFPGQRAGCYSLS